MTCKKKKYKHQWQAAHKITEIAAQDPLKEKKPIRSYFCNDCGNYHITSAPTTQKYLIKRMEDQQKRIDKLSQDWDDKLN